MGMVIRKTLREREEDQKLLEAPKADLKAKKDFAIHHNEYHRIIKQGDDLSDVPSQYHENLRTEGVL